MMKSVNKEEAWKRLEELTEKVEKAIPTLKAERDEALIKLQVFAQTLNGIEKELKEKEQRLDDYATKIAKYQGEVEDLKKRLATEDPLITAFRGFVQDQVKHVEKLASREGPIVLEQSKRQLVLEKLPPKQVPYADDKIAGQILVVMSTDMKKQWAPGDLNPLLEKKYGVTNKGSVSVELLRLVENGILCRTEIGKREYVYWFPENIELVNKS